MPAKREFIRYIATGLLTTLIGFGSYALFILMGLGVVAANTIATFMAVLFAFAANKIWVFKAHDYSKKGIAKEFAKFCSSRLFSYLVDTGLLSLLVYRMGYDPYLSKLGTAVIVVLLNYLTCKIIVFRK